MQNSKSPHPTKDRLFIRHQRKFLLLISRDDFQHDIDQLRRRWAIPSSGLKTPNEHETWWSQHNEDADNYELAHQHTNRTEMIEAEELWRRKEITIHELDTIKSKINLRNPTNALNADIDKIIERYHLSPRWREAIQSYLFTAQPVYRGSVGINITGTFGRIGDPDQITLTLDAHTTQQDLIDSWPSIKFHLSRLRHTVKAKAQPFDPEKFERNQLAHQLRTQGKTYRQIASILNEKYTEAYTYADIPTMVRNYKKLLGTN